MSLPAIHLEEIAETHMLEKICLQYLTRSVLNSKLKSALSNVSVSIICLFLVACSEGGDIDQDLFAESKPMVASANNLDSEIVAFSADNATNVSAALESSLSQVDQTKNESEESSVELAAATESPDTTTVNTETNDNSKQASIEKINADITDITETSAVFAWDAGEPATGKVLYGVTQTLESITKEETSFNYSAHSQTVNDLTPNTKYYARIESITQSGTILTSPIVEFTTKPISYGQQSSTPVVVTPTIAPAVSETDSNTNSGGINPGSTEQISTASGWPTTTNSQLPMGGIFYGNFQQGMLTGNAALAIHSARRFRADRSGYITAVSYPNRVLLDINITGRCLPDNPDSAWCKCVNAGLDSRSCGYTLSNSYSVGNGGAYRIQIRENDSATGMPSDNVLGEIANLFVPADNSSQLRPELTFKEKVYLEAGKIYHIVHWNERPPLTCSLRNVPINEAASCPRDRGAIGLNGIYLAHTMGLDGRLDPFRGSTSKNFFRTSNTGPWIEDEDNISLYDVLYEDGVWVGESYAGYGGTSVGDGIREIGGSTIARQVLTVRDATRIVNGLWLYFGHNYNKVPDGSPIQVNLKNESGESLATGSIAYSPECSERSRSGAASNNRRDQHCRHWGYTDFQSEVALLEGNTYYVEFSAETTGAYYFPTFFPIDYGGYDSISRNQWHDAQAEVSTNNGEDWELWVGLRWWKRDFGMLFTLKDMPKSLP